MVIMEEGWVREAEGLINFLENRTDTYRNLSEEHKWLKYITM